MRLGGRDLVVSLELARSSTHSAAFSWRVCLVGMYGSK